MAAVTILGVYIWAQVAFGYLGLEKYIYYKDPLPFTFIGVWYYVEAVVYRIFLFVPLYLLLDLLEIAIVVHGTYKKQGGAENSTVKSIKFIGDFVQQNFFN